MSEKLNNGAWKQMEQSWAKALKSVPPKAVEVEINNIYKGVSSRPIGFEVKYKIDGREYSIVFKN